MKALKSLLFVVVFSSSFAATAEVRSYQCGTLKDLHGCESQPYVSYLIQVDDGIVILQTVHGSERGTHYTTSSYLEHVSSTNESEVYKGGGIEARFTSRIEGRKVHNSLTISDRFHASADCHEVCLVNR